VKPIFVPWLYLLAGLWPLGVLIAYLALNGEYFVQMFGTFVNFLVR
jgi:hypothetical protein